MNEDDHPSNDGPPCLPASIEPPGSTESPTTADSQVELPKIIPFSSLSRCGDEVWIETGGQVYRLRKTRQGKLILTK